MTTPSDIAFELPLPDASAPPVPAAAPAPSLRPLPAVSASLPPTPRPPAACYLPDGTPLRLTISRKLMLLTLFTEIVSGPVSPYECAVLLFLAGNEPAAWNTPVPDAEGILAPLWTRPHDLKATVDEWLDTALASYEPGQVQTLALRLWKNQHQSQVLTIGEDAASGSEKKSPS